MFQPRLFIAAFIAFTFLALAICLQLTEASPPITEKDLAEMGRGVLSAAFSPDGQKVVTTTLNGNVLIWDAYSGEELQELKGHTSVVFSAVFSPDGKRIVTASRDKTARVWDVESGKELYQLAGHAFLFHTAFFSKDGKKIVTTEVREGVKIWDAATGKELQKFEN